MFLFLSLPIYADASGIGIMLFLGLFAVIAIVPSVLLILSVIVGAIHFYISRKLFGLYLQYAEIFGYTINSGGTGILIWIILFVINEKKYFNMNTFVIVVSISMVLFPILILLIQKIKSK